MSTSKPVGQSYAGEQKRQFAPIFRRRFADGIFGRCPHKAYLFPSLAGKTAKLSGNPSPPGKSLGKNKRCKSQDKRQQNSCKLTEFPDSSQIFRGEIKIKKQRKNKCHPQSFRGWQNIGREIFLVYTRVLPGNHLFDCFYDNLTVVTKVNICMVYIC